MWPTVRFLPNAMIKLYYGVFNTDNMCKLCGIKSRMPVVPPNIHTHRVNAVSGAVPHPVSSSHVACPRDRRQELRQRPAEEQ